MDPILPFLEAALDSQQAQPHIKAIWPETQRVTSATLLRHKLGRRALIAYGLETAEGDRTLIGKIRAKGTDVRTYELQQYLWQNGFDGESLDGYSVPEPIGLIPEWQMWLQHQVPGVDLTTRLRDKDGVMLMWHVSAIAHKLHSLPIKINRTHTLADEISILYERLPLVWRQYPAWRSRLIQILKACDQLAAMLPSALPTTGIHRDFYSDQILVEGERFWLVDLDLYCKGHPLLDIGNFLAHITEQSLREHADPTAMADRELALKSTFIKAALNSPLYANQSTASLEKTIDAYALFTLVRHIHISHRIPERNHIASAVLALCENRLSSILSQGMPEAQQTYSFRHLTLPIADE